MEKKYITDDSWPHDEEEFPAEVRSQAGWRLRNNPTLGFYYVAADPHGVCSEILRESEMSTYLRTHNDYPLMEWEKELYNG